MELQAAATPGGAPSTDVFQPWLLPEDATSTDVFLPVGGAFGGGGPIGMPIAGFDELAAAPIAGLAGIADGSTEVSSEES